MSRHPFFESRDFYLKPKYEQSNYNSWLENAVRAGNVSMHSREGAAPLPQRSRENMQQAIAYHASLKQREQDLRNENAYLRDVAQRQHLNLSRQTDELTRLTGLFSRTRVEDDHDLEYADPGPSNYQRTVPREQRLPREERHTGSVGQRRLHFSPDRAEPAPSGGGGEPDDSPMSVEVLPTDGGANPDRPAAEHAEPE